MGAQRSAAGGPDRSAQGVPGRRNFHLGVAGADAQRRSPLAIVGRRTALWISTRSVGRTTSEITRATDWRDYTLRMVELFNRLACHYIKRDLQPYLPAGYPNPFRVKQHRAP